MIKRLRRKLIAACMVSLAIVLAVILGGVNLMSYRKAPFFHLFCYVVIPFSKPWWSRPRRESAAESAGGQKRGG